MFAASQTYAIIVLPNGGPDLEAYTFDRPTKTAWRQACSIFWQVARALANAEALVSFEHRDLHWGQILVRDAAPPKAPSKGRRTMDDRSHGVQATVIDLGLARMSAHDETAAPTWTPFDEEIFEGEGDYQFDIYRLMREHHGRDWSRFRPLTNVMVRQSYILWCMSADSAIVASLSYSQAAEIQGPPCTPYAQINCSIFFRVLRT